jgi:hypothetical protein
MTCPHTAAHEEILLAHSRSFQGSGSLRDDFTHAINLVSHLFPCGACVSQPPTLAALQVRARSIAHFSAGTFSIDLEQWSAFSLESDRYQAWKYWESWAHLHREPVCAPAFLSAVFGSGLAFKVLLTSYCYLSDSIAPEI